MDEHVIDLLLPQHNIILNCIAFQDSIVDEARCERNNLIQELVELNE